MCQPNAIIIFLNILVRSFNEVKNKRIPFAKYLKSKSERSYVYLCDKKFTLSGIVLRAKLAPCNGNDQMLNPVSILNLEIFAELLAHTKRGRGLRCQKSYAITIIRWPTHTSLLCMGKTSKRLSLRLLNYPIIYTLFSYND